MSPLEASLILSTVLAVDCPANSVGNDVVEGCTLNDGYVNEIVPTTTDPFYSGGSGLSPQCVVLLC